MTGLSHDFNLVFSSIELPLNVKYSFKGKGLYVFGGIAVGKILTFDDKTTINTYPGNSFIKGTSALEMTNVLLRFNGGVGYEIPVGQRSILLEADYRFSSNITKTSTGTPSAHLGGVTFTLGVPLTKSKK